MDIFGKSGAWYSYQGNKIGQGKTAARDWLHAHPEEMKAIEEQIKAKIAENSGLNNDDDEETLMEETYEDTANA